MIAIDRSKVKAASKVRRRIIAAKAAARPKITSTRDMARLIESLAATLDDYHYCRMRSKDEVRIVFIDGRKMHISVSMENA